MRATVFALTLLMVATVSLGQATLSGVNLGQHATGPRVSADDLRGKVVLFEYWGNTCPPCIRSIPHLVHLQETYDREKFIIVANQVWGGSASNAGNIWKRHAGGKDIVSVINGGSLPGANVRGVPHCFLFNHEGKLVFNGHPARVDEHVAKAVAAVPPPLLAGVELEVLNQEGKLIASMKRNMSTTLNRLRTMAGDPSHKGHDEATLILEHVEAWAEKTYTKVSTNPKDDPKRTQSRLDEALKLLRGDVLGRQFEDLDKQLRNDPSFTSELRAMRAFEKLQHRASMVANMRPGSKANNMRNGLRRDIAKLKKRFPDTKAAKKADELARQLNL